MKQAIVNFCKSTDTGLFLLDMPTGFGKTYSVLEFMVDYYDSPEFKDKKIFFVTTLKKNLPDKELREHFAKRGKADDYDKYCLRIEANADMVVEKLDELYRARKIPAAITMKQEFKDLHGSVKLLNEYRDKKRELKGTSKDIINVLCKNAEDIVLTYLGMLCMGKPYFEAVHEMDDDKDFYKTALGITRSIPSEDYSGLISCTLFCPMSIWSHDIGTENRH